MVLGGRAALPGASLVEPVFTEYHNSRRLIVFDMKDRVESDEKMLSKHHGPPMREEQGLRGLVTSTKRHALLFFDYFTQYAKVRVSYRGDFFISLGTSFAATVFALWFVVILFHKATQLAGWRFEEVLFLYGFSLIPYGIFNIVSMNLYDFGNNFIIEGKFDRVLLRPISSLFQVLFETFRIESLQEVATGIFCLWWASKRLSLPWTAGKFAMLFFFGTCAAI